MKFLLNLAPDQRLGIGKLLMQVWGRYGLPVVVTEVHLGDCVEEQIRWLGEVWRQAEEAKREGIDVRAITVWALFGL